MDPQEKSLQDKIFVYFAKRSPQIIANFKYLYAAIILFLFVGGFFTVTNSSLQPLFYALGKKTGQAAIALLGFVVLPGILGRFGIEIKVTRVITLFRRQLGITVFLLALTHYSLVRLFLYLSGGLTFKLPLALFETMGSLALYILFLLFLTSNNYSVKKLGKWWKRLHRLVYLALWLLVLHTSLQRLSIWSVGILAVAILEVTSLIYSYFKKKSVKATGTLNTP